MINAWLLSVLLCRAASAERSHTVVEKDTLWDLASRYYGDPFQWRKISEANPPPEVRDPHWIYPGQRLIIPDLEAAGQPQDQAEEKPEAEPAPIAAAPPPEPAVEPAPAPPAQVASESISTRFPEGLVAQPPSNVRLLAKPGWSADGAVSGFEGQESMAAEGDLIDIRLKPGLSASPGERFFVFRKAAPGEADADKKATYLVEIGRIRIKKVLADGGYRAVILKSNDSLQIADLVQRGG